MTPLIPVQATLPNPLNPLPPHPPYNEEYRTDSLSLLPPLKTPTKSSLAVPMLNNIMLIAMTMNLIRISRAAAHKRAAVEEQRVRHVVAVAVAELELLRAPRQRERDVARVVRQRRQRADVRARALPFYPDYPVVRFVGGLDLLPESYVDWVSGYEAVGCRGVGVGVGAGGDGRAEGAGEEGAEDEGGGLHFGGWTFVLLNGFLWWRLDL